jgi:hypothetical protein
MGGWGGILPRPPRKRSRCPAPRVSDLLPRPPHKRSPELPIVVSLFVTLNIKFIMHRRKFP